jgi:AcrR family transcriptional regulator
MGETPNQELVIDDGLRGKIVAAALHRFARAGYGKSSIKDIAADAGVTSGAVYHYFSSKPELYRQAGALTFRRVTEAYARIMSTSEGQSQRARVEALFEAISAMVYEHQDHHWLGISSNMDSARYPQVAETRDEWARELEELYRRVAEVPAQPDDAGWDRDPLIVMMGVLALGSGCVVVRDGPEALRAAVEGLRGFFAEPAPDPGASRGRT